VQEVIKEMAKSRPLTSDGVKGFKGEWVRGYAKRLYGHSVSFLGALVVSRICHVHAFVHFSSGLVQSILGSQKHLSCRILSFCDAHLR
jgi:hypothetical protein